MMLRRRSGRCASCVAVVAVGILMVCAGIIAHLANWWHTGTTPVEVHLHAPASARIFVGWDEASAPLRLVAMDDAIDGWHGLWSTELPPRPVYRLRIDFDPIDESMRFQELRVVSLERRRMELARFFATDTSAWSIEGVATDPGAEGTLTVAAPNGGRIGLVPIIDLRPAQSLGTLGLPFLNLIILGGLGAALIGSGLFFPWQLPRRDERWGPALRIGVIVIFVFAAGIHWRLVVNAVPGFWPSDSTSYADKALALAYSGTYDTGGHEYELNRSPGFPLLAAFAFRIFGPSVNAAVQVQTALALACFGIFFWQIRRLLPSWMLMAGIPLTLLSPPLIWASRQFATESVFVSFWVLATGCAVQAWQASDGPRRWLPWTGFIAAATAATMVRANGILLLTIPGCAMIGMAVRSWQAAPGLWRCALPDARRAAMVLVPFVVVAVVLGAWSLRNYYSRGYPAPTDLAPVVASNAPFTAGMLDVRVFDDPEEYEWILRQRRAQGYFFQGWSLRNRQFMNMWRANPNFDHTTIGHLAEQQRAFVAENNARLPWQARIVAWWRVLGWGLWVPEWGPFTQDSLWTSYAVPARFEHEWLHETVHQRIEWLARDRPDGAPPFPRLHISEGRPDFLQDLYNAIVPLYPWIYRTLTAAGLVAFAAAIWARVFAPVLLLMPFFVNVLLNVWFLYVIGRYLHVLDAMLLFGVLAACAAIWGSSARGRT